MLTKEAYVGDGQHVNSGFLDGLDKEEAIATSDCMAWKKKAKDERKSHSVFATGCSAVNVTGASRFRLFIGKMAR